MELVTLNGIAQKLKNNNIITSVVCYNSEASTFEPIYSMTNGIQTSISGDFLTQLEVFVKTVMSQNANYFCAVNPTDLSLIQLSKTPDKNDMVTNDDLDSKVNSQEIDWTLINTTAETLELPTLNEYWKSLSGTDSNCFKRFTEKRQNILNSFVVLPTTSNPTVEDTDGDGYWDDVDPRPCYPDVYTVRLNNKDYIPVQYDGPESYSKKSLYYGGNQSWFYDDNINNSFNDQIIEDGGCGALASTDLIMYCTLLRAESKTSMPFKFQTGSGISTPYISYKDYTDMVKTLVNDYRKPFTYRLSIHRGGPEEILMQGTLGYLSDDVEYLITNYLKNHSVNLQTESQRISSKNRDQCLGKMLLQIDDEIPVPIMSGLPRQIKGKWDRNTGMASFEKAKPIMMRQIDPQTGSPVIDSSTGKQAEEVFDVHWVNVVGIVKDDIKGTTTMEVASWGEKYLIDFDDYVENNGLLSSVIWI